MQVTKEIRFEAAHRLQDHPGACCNLHGHSYRMEVTVEGAISADGMVVDFGKLSVILREIIDDGGGYAGTGPWDHATILEEGDPLADVIVEHTDRVIVLLKAPTAENMSKNFANLIQRELDSEGLQSCRVRRVRLWETEKSFVTWDVYDD